MIKKQGSIEVHGDGSLTEGLFDHVNSLPEGEYGYLIYDQQANRPLPQLKYLFGVVLKTISQQLPDHPSVNALYRYFEEVYAPIHSCTIMGEQFEYYDLKNDKSIEMDDVITRIIHHATDEWGISIPTKDEIKEAEAKEAYVDAYADMWKNFTRNN